MPTKKTPRSSYILRGIDRDFAPFQKTDFDTLAHAVAPTEIKISRVRFAKLALDLNKAARNWKVYTDIEPAPTDKQERAYIEKIGKAAAKLGRLLGATSEELDAGMASFPRNEPEFASEEVPFDEARIDHAKETGGVFPEGFRDDPTAEGAWSVPLALDRVLHHFSQHYAVHGSGSQKFGTPEEALNELPTMLEALEAGAAARLAELAETEDNGREAEETKPFDGKLRGDMEITLGGAKSPNHAFFLELIPIYEELFGRPLGRSRTSPAGSDTAQPGNQPSGPALKFFRFVFDRLPEAARPSDETINDWIKDWLRAQKPGS